MIGSYKQTHCEQTSTGDGVSAPYRGCFYGKVEIEPDPGSKGSMIVRLTGGEHYGLEDVLAFHFRVAGDKGEVYEEKDDRYSKGDHYAFLKSEKDRERNRSVSEVIAEKERNGDLLLTMRGRSGKDDFSFTYILHGEKQEARKVGAVPEEEPIPEDSENVAASRPLVARVSLQVTTISYGPH